VNYVPDLVGGQRRSVEALGAVVDLQRRLLAATYLSLTSNVVNTAIARPGGRHALAVNYYDPAASPT
jgi:hypothetical protein